MLFLPGIKRTLGVLLFTYLAFTPVSHAALIELQPGDTFAANGDSISLDLVISGLGDFTPDSLGAFDISLSFDASALSFTGYELGDFLGDINFLQAIDVSAGDVGGAVNVAEVSLLSAASLDALQPGAFTLATLNFDVINVAVGSSTALSVLSGAVLSDAFGAALLATTGGPASVHGVPVNVPAPGTFFLLVLTLFGCLMWQRDAAPCSVK